MKTTRLWLSLSTLLSITTLHASNIECPTTIVIKEIVTDQKGWENTGFPSARTLKSATLFIGKLGDTLSALAPEQKEKDHQVTQTWNLKPYHTKGEPIWLECQYFETTLKLRKVIPSKINHCESRFLVDQFHNLSRNNMPLSCQ